MSDPCPVFFHSLVLTIYKIHFTGEENWRGKNPTSSARTRRRSKYSILEKTIEKVQNVPILKNGRRKEYSKKLIVFTYNTCGFDTIFQIFATVFVDYESLQVRFKESIDLFRSMIITAFDKDKVASRKMDDLYNRRDTICKTIYETTTPKTNSNLLMIDCVGNISYTIEHVLPQVFFSYTVTKSCTLCENSVLSHRVYIDINLDEFAGEQVSIQNLNDHINHELLLERISSKCTNTSCFVIFKVDAEFSKIIMIDVQLTGERPNKQFSINEAPQTLQISGVEYKILALIQFIKTGESIEDVGYYVAHVRRINNEWKTYDDKSAKVQTPNRNSRMEIHTLFYIQSSVK